MMLRSVTFFIAAIALIAVGAGITRVIAGDGPQRDAQSTSRPDPTVIPTATLPARVPPNPALITPTAVPNDPPFSRPTRHKPQIPDAAAITRGADERLWAVGGDGCEWIEKRRVQSAHREYPEIIFVSSCSSDVFLYYTEETGEIRVLTP